MKNNVTGVRIALESLVRSLPRVKVVHGSLKLFGTQAIHLQSYDQDDIGQKYNLDSIDQLHLPLQLGFFFLLYYCFNVTLIHHSFCFNLSHS